MGTGGPTALGLNLGRRQGWSLLCLSFLVCKRLSLWEATPTQYVCRQKPRTVTSGGLSVLLSQPLG